MQVTTNNVPRALINGFELSEKEREGFDYKTSEEIDVSYFFRYKGMAYDVGEFVKTNHFPNWSAYSSDSYFSGIVIRLSDDDETVIVGTYYS